MKEKVKNKIKEKNAGNLEKYFLWKLESEREKIKTVKTTKRRKKSN